MESMHAQVLAFLTNYPVDPDVRQGDEYNRDAGLLLRAAAEADAARTAKTPDAALLFRVRRALLECLADGLTLPGAIERLESAELVAPRTEDAMLSFVRSAAAAGTYLPKGWRK